MVSKMNQNMYEMFKENSLMGTVSEREERVESINHSLYMEKMKDLFDIILYPNLEKKEAEEKLIHALEKSLMLKEEEKSGEVEWTK